MITYSGAFYVGLWGSPILSGSRPPPSDGFTLTSIDAHRAVLFGGILHDRQYINDVYIINFQKMVDTCSMFCMKILAVFLVGL